MAKQVRDVMNKKPIKLDRATAVVEAARQMRAASVGAVLVADDGRLAGIVTDRDITVRVVAQGRDPSTTRLADVCSCELTTLSPDDDVDRAIEVMRTKAVRRLPVVDASNQPVGIVSLGDLELERNPSSVLGRISAAPPNQ
jgi:CBS domain-containing protein